MSADDNLAPFTPRSAIDILESVSDGFVALDNEWRCTYVNAAAERINGMSRDQFLGRHILDVFPQAVGSTFDLMYQKAFTQRVPVEFEAFYPPQRQWYSVRAFPSAGGISIFFRDVTQAKAAEEERQRLHEQVARKAAELETVLQSIADPVYVGTADGIARCNAAGLAMSGVASVDELNLTVGALAAKFNVRFAADGRPVPSDQTPYARALRGETVSGEELISTRLDTGQDVYMRSTAAPLMLDGRIVGAVGTNTDITQLKQAQEKLRRSESQLAEAQEVAAIGSWSWELGGGDTATCSDELYRLFGLRPQETVMTRDRIVDLFHPDDWPAIERAGERAARDHEPFEFTVRGLHADGTTRALACRGRVVADERGNPVRMLGTLQDVTRRQRADEESRQFMLLVQNSGDFIGMCDKQFVPFFVNEAGLRIVGLDSAEQALRTPVAQFVLDEDRAFLLDQFLPAVVRDGRAEAELRFRNFRTGQPVWMTCAVFVLRDAGGKHTGFATVCRDITARKRDQEAMRRATEQAEAANTAKDEFLATISHELRTPLSAILLWANLLRAGSLKPRDRRQALDFIVQSVNAQRRLIDDLLDTSQMVAGELRLEVREADLEPVVRAAVEVVRPMADAKGVALDYDPDPGVGRVRADPHRVQQVVWNLLNNAVKFTERGGRVAVALRRVDRALRIEVADTGRGISPQFLPHVFDRFRQADASLTRAHGGLGLGLAIVRQLVELHGGTIRADSAGEGRGATFTAELPLPELPPEPPAEVKALPLPHRAGQAPLLRGVRALVVEDDANSRAAIKLILEGSEAEVTAVASAVDALAAFRQAVRGRGYDALVSDIGLPVQDGYELIRAIRQLEHDAGDPRPIPALAMTAYAHDEDRAKALAAGFQRHVAKPVEPSELIAAIASLARRPDA